MTKVRVGFIGLAMALAVSVHGQGVKISDEPRAATVGPADLVLISQHDTTKAVTLANLLNNTLTGQVRFTVFTVTPAMLYSGSPVIILTPPTAYAVEILAATLRYIPGDTLYDSALGVSLTDYATSSLWGFFGYVPDLTMNTAGASLFTIYQSGLVDIAAETVAVAFTGPPPTVGNGTLKIYITYVFKRY